MEIATLSLAIVSSIRLSLRDHYNISSLYHQKRRLVIFLYFIQVTPVSLLSSRIYVSNRDWLHEEVLNYLFIKTSKHILAFDKKYFDIDSKERVSLISLINLHKISIHA